VAGTGGRNPHCRRLDRGLFPLRRRDLAQLTVATPIVILLIVAAGLAHATWNLIVKRSAVSGAPFVWLTGLGAAAAVIPIAVVVALLDPPSWPFLALAAAVSGILQTTYFLALQAGYRAGDVSVVYPLARGTGPLLSVLLAIALFGERPHFLALAGAGAVVIGVILIGLAGGRAHWRAARPGVLWGLLIGVVIASYTLWDARAVTALALSPILLNAGTSTMGTLLLAPVAIRRWPAVRAVWREHWREVVAVSVLSSLSYILVLFAMQLAPVSIVAPAREISVVFVGLAGWLLFKEPHPVVRLTGAVVVLGGIVLLAVAR
jgi:drug/metabolite transporter (DMT)-like permease